LTTASKHKGIDYSLHPRHISPTLQHPGTLSQPTHWLLSAPIRHILSPPIFQDSTYPTHCFHCLHSNPDLLCTQELIAQGIRRHIPTAYTSRHKVTCVPLHRSTAGTTTATQSLQHKPHTPTAYILWHRSVATTASHLQHRRHNSCYPIAQALQQRTYSLRHQALHIPATAYIVTASQASSTSSCHTIALRTDRR